MSADGGRDNKEQIRAAVRDGYGKIAQSGSGCGRSSTSCCGSTAAEQVAKSVGYSEAELAVCEPCFKYHYGQAQKLGVSNEDIAALLKSV